MTKKDLSERDICSKFITPHLEQAGWDRMQQIREEVSLTNGRIIVRGKLVARGHAKRADYVLYYKPNIPIAVIEAKDNRRSVGSGIQQALDYAAKLRLPPDTTAAERTARVKTVADQLQLTARLDQVEKAIEQRIDAPVLEVHRELL